MMQSKYLPFMQRYADIYWPVCFLFSGLGWLNREEISRRVCLITFCGRLLETPQGGVRLDCAGQGLPPNRRGRHFPHHIAGRDVQSIRSYYAAHSRNP